MPNIIITLNIAQVNRVKTVLDVTTADEVADILKKELKNIVTRRARELERITANSTIDQDLINEGW